MINRKISSELLILVDEYPVITILGPRQAGKTTLAKNVLKGYEYSNLEIPETRMLAQTDPKAYLHQFKSNVIIDEIQRVPELLSYIQGIVDEKNQNGQFILTGSHQLRLHEAVVQSLAGRTAILHLLPLSIKELQDASIELGGFEEYCFTGFLPRVYDKSLRPRIAYSNYYQTYVERDVRQLINLKDLSLFEKFLRLLAGRVGQVIDYTSISNDVGVTVKTVQNWLSILEASFIIFKLPPYFNNFGKRVIKSPKYYFTDVGLLCFLLNIRQSEQVLRDPLVGNIFENLVVLECLKSQFNRGESSGLYFYRSSNGNEVDILFTNGREITAIEIKAASTFSDSQLRGLRHFKKITDLNTKSFLVYNGASIALSDSIYLMNFKEIDRVFN